MCSDPQTKDGQQFACRKCNECIATRRHGWVARAMAEKAMWPHAACITLTYSVATQEGRDGAAMFNYSHVSDFMKRLRSAAAYEAKKRGLPKPRFRFLCAGEQGDRYGRCHWHLIIYSDCDLRELGEFIGRVNGKRRRVVWPDDRAHMMTVGKRKRRLDWSIWNNERVPFGYVTLQEPDQGGMSYVLSYCLKDQFTVEASKGTMRQAKAERFATGLFRMSKRPAIGHDWLMQKLESLAASGNVLPAPNLKVPGFGGYWQPGGDFRKKLLWGMRAINQRVLWETGRNAPQWTSLLASCSTIPSDMECLNGEKEREEPLEVTLERVRNQQAGEQRLREFRRRCGAVIACDDCLHEYSASYLQGQGIERYTDEGGVWRYRIESVPDRYAPGWRLNSLCRQVGSKTARLAFPKTGAGEAGGPANLQAPAR